MAVTRLTGRLLVAAHDLTDLHFRRSVVLILAYDPSEGAAGVILNRPVAAEPPERLTPWTRLTTPPSAIFRGGPVGPDTVIGIAEGAGVRDHAEWQHIAGDLKVVDLTAAPPLDGDIGVRLFVGYAGWGVGQLEGEIAAGGWFVVDALPGDASTADPDGLWRAVLARQGGLFTTVPIDPALN